MGWRRAELYRAAARFSSIIIAWSSRNINEMFTLTGSLLTQFAGGPTSQNSRL
jgi:hypothetical protein